MSDLQRISSPLSSSPGRTASLSRPDWPWSSLRYSHRSSQSSLNSVGASTQSGASWEHRSVASSSTSMRPPSTGSWGSGSALTKQNTGMTTMGYAGNEETTRQWTFFGFDWIVRDVHKLQEYVEGIDLGDEVEREGGESTVPAGDFDILKQSPVLGDNKFKLEIARTTRPSEGNSDAKSLGLSLYITSLMLDFAHAEYEIPTTMMAAIKCQEDLAGQRGARPDWVWEYWHNDWVFRHESEVWECTLPPLSALLENSRIRDTDSFVISVQIHCPFGPTFPAQPSAYFVPRDLLDGLEASLDNPNTGDVRFVCLERYNPDAAPLPSGNPEMASPVTNRPPSSTSTQAPFAHEMTARKRVIYAHSDILTRRSEYFATMLTSSFSENQGIMSGERKLFTIVVEEADFETIYWLLKFCYANWLLFKEVDDPRAAVEGVGAGWSAHWLNTRGGEWDWKTFAKHGSLEDGVAGDARSAASGESLLSTGDRSRSPASNTKTSGVVSTPIRPVQSVSSPRASKGTTAPSTSRVANATTTTTRRVTQPQASGNSSMGMNLSGAGSVRSKQVPIPISIPASNFPATTHYPVSPHSQRPRGSNTISTPDPHMHPTPHPPPASALSMYQVAHRYAMPGLSTLALEHMLSTITPQSSFALLLATSAWDELHSLVEDYVVEKWDEVHGSVEFEQCCDEVAAGEWGPEGGKTLTALFRRLRSPSALIFARA